jgi:XapX domain-containing protein
MKAYLIALAVGLLVSAIYGLLNVRSPAPPVIALIGLLGILSGEQCGEHVFGRLPSRPGAQATAPNPAESPADPKPETAA